MVCVRIVSGMWWVWVGDVYEVWVDGLGLVLCVGYGRLGLWVVVYVQCGPMAGD